MARTKFKLQQSTIVIIVAMIILIILAYLYFGQSKSTDSIGRPDLPEIIKPSVKANIQVTPICKDAEKNIISCTIGTQAMLNSVSGIFYVQYKVSISNSGTVNIDSAQVSITSLSPASDEILAAFSTISSSKAIAAGQSVSWTTDDIDLSILGDNTYNFKVKVLQNAAGYDTITKETAVKMDVKQEGIGFSMNVNTI